MMHTLEKATDLEKAFFLCIESLTWSLETANEYVASFDRSLNEAVELRGKGVKFNHEENSLQAIDSFVNLIPTGNEVGNYYAIDLGGTNLRTVCIKLMGNGQNSTIQKNLNIRATNVTPMTPKGLLDRNSPATLMFDTMAQLTKELMLEVGDDPKDQRNVSFTFSFPIRQQHLACGELIQWTKEFETGINTNDPVEGQDVAYLLNRSFQRHNMNSVVGAVANDTIGTLLSAGYENNKHMPVARVGVIIGTGFNIAAYDPSSLHNNFEGTMINYECGNYAGVSRYCTPMDIELDFYSSNPSRQLAEKMIAGQYLGELSRLAILKVFQWRAPQPVYKRWSFGTTKAAKIYGDNTKRYKTTQSVLKDCFDWNLTDESQLRFIYKIVCAVFDRSATIAALMTSVMANRTRFLQRALGGVTVAIDGSIFLKNMKYRRAFRKTVDRILGNRSEFFHIVTATDGSGKGAAVIAACQEAANYV